MTILLGHACRAALHWAAYKGYSDTVRLLLVLGASWGIADKEGCTPLHWAAIRGNGEVCTLLLQGGSPSLLKQPDVTGSTPAQLAVEKNHRCAAAACDVLTAEQSES